jgi:hypothetical protein
MKIAIICRFTNNEVQDIIKPWKRVKIFAPWIYYYIEEFKKYPEHEFHIISLHEWLFKDRQYVEKNIHFYFIVVQTGAMGASAYGASKAGLWRLTKSLAKGNGRKNITINNLNIGYFDIGIISEVPEDYQNYLKKQIPSAKLGDPEEIFKVIKYLIESEYVNGASIDINGGLF